MDMQALAGHARRFRGWASLRPYVTELLAEHPGTGGGSRCVFAGASGVDGVLARMGATQPQNYSGPRPAAQM